MVDDDVVGSADGQLVPVVLQIVLREADRVSRVDIQDLVWLV